MLQFALHYLPLTCMHTHACVCVALCAELSFLETSALTGENVEEVFMKCARTILAKIDAGKLIFECRWLTRPKQQWSGLLCSSLPIPRGTGPRPNGIWDSVWRRSTEEVQCSGKGEQRKERLQLLVCFCVLPVTLWNPATCIIHTLL